MRIIKIIAAVLLVIFLLAQFIRPAKNQDNSTDPQQDIAQIYPMPAGVYTVLKNACYDCHSNHTQYPWYAHIQPAASYLAQHIRAGKKDLNFSTYGNYSPKRKRNKLKHIREQVNTGKMPLPSYTLLHPEARLTPAQKTMLLHWIDSTLAVN